MNNSKGDKLITTNQDTTGIDDFDFENTTEDLDLTEDMDLEVAVNPAEAAAIDAELTKETSIETTEAISAAINAEILAEMTAEDLDEAPKVKKTKKTKTPKAPKAPKVKVAKAPKAPKVKVIKAKCSKESLSVMAAGMAAIVAVHPNDTEVSRKDIMEVGKGLVLKDVYREMLHPSFKGAARGMYTIAVIVASLEKQIALLS